MVHPRLSSNIHVHIPNGTFTDVQGDFHFHLNSQTIQSETGLLELFRASSPDAAFDSVDRYPPPKCLPGTRADLLNEIEYWIDLDVTKICWVHGPAGAGKSAIAQTVSETCSARGQLAASFFFSRSAPSRSHSRRFFTTIAHQIAHSVPQTRQAICKAVEDDLQILHKQHSAQLKQLLILPLSSPSSSSAPNPPFLVIVDGLDECDGDQSELLLHIRELVGSHRLPLRFLIFSRPEPKICHFFDTVAMDASTRISIYGDHQAREDVHFFLRTGFNTIHNSERHSAIMKHVPKPWPSDEVVQLLADRSGGYFIYASTVLKYVDEEYSSCIDRLQDILEVSKSGSSAFAELDKLYMQILSIYPDTDLLLRVLGGVITRVRSPLQSHDLDSVESLQAILGLRPGQVEQILRGLHSVLDIQVYDNHIEVVAPFHASFPQFLVDQSRAGRYYIDQENVNADLVRGMADLMRDYDKRNSSLSAVGVGPIIYNLFKRLSATNPPNEDALIEYLDESSRAWESCILASSKWSCLDKEYLVSMLDNFKAYLNAREHPPAKFIERVSKLLDLACQCQISLHLTAIVSALIIGEELPTYYYDNSTIWAIFRMSWSPDDSYTDDRVLQKVAKFLLFQVEPFGLRRLYWEFLDHPERCGLLYNERAKCYTRIVNYWLLFLEAYPGSKRPDSEVHRACHTIVLHRWSRLLHKCVPGDKDLICRLRDFTLHKARKEDVERVVAWLEMDSNIPKDVLIRWKTYDLEQYSLPSYEVAPVQRVRTYAGGAMMAPAMSFFASLLEPIRDRLLG